MGSPVISSLQQKKLPPVHFVPLGSTSLHKSLFLCTLLAIVVPAIAKTSVKAANEILTFFIDNSVFVKTANFSFVFYLLFFRFSVSPSLRVNMFMLHNGAGSRNGHEEAIENYVLVPG